MAQITKQQVIDLINQKISGQGSAVDVGGALPAILKGLADMGISSDMSETEQMQARKDLGLYYEETTTGGKTVVSDGVQDSKLSDDAPSKDSIVNVLNPENESVEYTITDIENGYQIKTQLEDGNKAVFYVITDGDSKGIFDSGAFYGMGYKLVYSGPITTISKVPEQYLPEIPSGGLETVVLKKIPTEDEYNANISDYLSNDDLQKLLDFDACVAVYDEKRTFLVILNKNPDMMGNVPYRINFIDETGVVFFIYYDGISSYYVTIPDNSNLIELTQLPTAGMTSQELAAIGITSDAMSGVRDGKKTGFTLPYGNGFFPVLSADFVSTSLIVEFWSSSNKYVITMDMTMYTASCTVTPRT